MAIIYVENKPYEVEDGKNLLSTCLSLGFNVPYFCWHPALHSVGSCRLCAVKQFRDAKDTRGQIVMSCMTPAEDGVRISISDPEVLEFRAAVIQWLMMNHPHDCPVCDEGGECHLQDMTVMTGHNYRKYRFRKQTYRNQDLGPFLKHEMNRCIKCYRCVRFYRNYAGGRDLNVFGVHERLYFGRSRDGFLESEFSGNLAEICPTGVFTDKTLSRHYARKWDLQTAPSVCVHCGAGCNTSPAERYGTLRRIQNRYNSDVNGYFLCDRGRFGYEFVNHDSRIRSCHGTNSGGVKEPLSPKSAVRRAAEIIAGSSRVIGIGSPRASLESNFALRALVGPDNFCSGMSRKEQDLVSSILDVGMNGPVPFRSLHDVERSDAVLVLGEDVLNTSPRVALSLRQSVRVKPMSIARRLQIPDWNDRAVRQAVQEEKGPMFIVTAAATGLDDIATETFRATGADVATIGFAMAHELDGNAPEAINLSEDARRFASRVAAALREAKRPLVISGTGAGERSVIEAAANVAWALAAQGRDACLFFAVPECNSMGAAMMGGAPLEAAAEKVEEEPARTVIVVENNLFRRCDHGLVGQLLARAGNVIALDHIETKVTPAATLTFPSATFAEAHGTLVSCEGRAQRFFKVFQPSGDIKESWEWLREIMLALGLPDADQWKDHDELVGDLAASFPVFAKLPDVAPSSEFRIGLQKIPRQPHRYSGRTAILAHRAVSEPAPLQDSDSPLAFSMEGYQGRPPSSLVSRNWSPGWNSVQALNKFQSEVGGPLCGGDPGMRLIEPCSAGAKYFTSVPEPFEPRLGQWLLVPLYHIFGSEELSVLGPAVAQRVPEPYLRLNPTESAKLGIRDGSSVVVSVGNRTLSLIVKIVPSLPDGAAGLPVGLVGLEGISLPAWGRISPTSGGPKK